MMNVGTFNIDAIIIIFSQWYPCLLAPQVRRENRPRVLFLT